MSAGSRVLRWITGPNKTKLMRFFLRLLVIASGLIFQLPVTQAEILASVVVTDKPGCPSQQSSIVLTGRQVSALIGLPVKRMLLYRWSGQHMQPIVFQVDRRDKEDRYIFPTEAETATVSRQVIFDANDELVFMQRDAGLRLPAKNAALKHGRLIEIQIGGPEKQQYRWVYVRIFSSVIRASGNNPVNYNPDTDKVTTELYQLGFSRQAPFLVNRFSWWDDSEKRWSPNLLDSMKIRHNGTLLGLFAFNRTQDDYSSRLVAVRQGPLRVIRRTENHVRVFLGLRTPALYIDYVLAPDGFVMDTVIDIPFPMGLFFSRLETLTTVDWNPVPELAAMRVSNAGLPEELQIDGVMSEDKQAFNRISDWRFAVTGPLGVLRVSLEIADDIPIKTFLYLRDAMHEPDPPEAVAGQFGNMGFRTTGWENIDTEVHHLRFRVCLFKG